MKHDIEVTSDFQCNKKPVKGTAKWSQIETFYQLDKTNPNLVYAPQLTDNHLRPNCQQKMRVKLAAQVFNHSVTTGMLMKIAQNNWYTTVSLARELMKNETHLIGTLRKNRKHFPKVIVSTKLKKGEFIAKESDDGITVLRWKDKRDVLVLSTKHSTRFLPINKHNKNNYETGYSS
ncbi:unnamed protein product [Parnassius mnemosyne]|uniref:PiggyBac transposable element-derived protein domain-containing protein n=1 Tax=Parnassius mnemosyne TaxID=213953 RepID=A0AAV1LCH5_9NEOP